MPELKFAITQQQKTVLSGSIYGPLAQVLATPVVLAEGSLTQASIQTLELTLLWMNDKACSPRLKTRIWIILHSFIQIYDRDFYLSPFKRHTPVLRSQVHTSTVFLIQQS